MRLLFIKLRHSKTVECRCSKLIVYVCALLSKLAISCRHRSRRSARRVPLVVGENCCCAIIYAVAVNLVGGCKIKGSRSNCRDAAGCGVKWGAFARRNFANAIMRERRWDKSWAAACSPAATDEHPFKVLPFVSLCVCVHQRSRPAGGLLHIAQM
jgi:hypothetical protein